MEKILTISEILTYLSHWRLNNKKIVLTNGCFDLLHVGHLKTFQKAKQLGDILIVGVNSDRSVQSLKGQTRPIIPENARAELIAALEPVDYVLIFDQYTATDLIELIQPHIYVKGGDYQLDNLPEKEVIKKFNIKVEFVPLVPNISTTEIINRIRTANF